MIRGHGGDRRDAGEKSGISPDSLIDFSSNVNCPITRKVLKKWVSASSDRLNEYPDPEYAELIAGLSRKYSIDKNNLLPGNGSTELLYLFFRAYAPRKVLLVSPSYQDYEDAAVFSGAKITRFKLSEKEGFQLSLEKMAKKLNGFNAVIIGNPNNPTGNVNTVKDLINLIKKYPKILFFIDEAFIDFAPGESLLQSLYPNLFVLRSLTKFYGIPGLRIGFIASVTQNILKLSAKKEPWTINHIAEQVALNICTSDIKEEGIVRNNELEKERLYSGLKGIEGLHPFPSRANFLLVKISNSSLSAPELKRRLLKKMILIRDCSNFKQLSDKYFRVAVRKRQDNIKLLDALKEVL